jgi:ferritin
MKSNVLALMTDQVKNELESAYLYLSMAAWLHAQNYDGMAGWMRSQVHEETVHGMKLLNHLLERGQEVKLPDIKQHRTTWGSVLEVWEDTLKHEQFVTGKIHDLLGAAREAKDYAAEVLLQWYVTEQVEEEASAGKVLDQVRKTGESKGGLIMLDHHLRHRSAPEGSPFAEG